MTLEYSLNNNECQDPLPLMRVIEKGDPFPVDVLPPVMKNAILRVHDVVQAPLDLVCQSFLASVTLAVQPHVDVLIDGRKFPCSNNFIAIGVSGERKSAVDRIAIGPIKEKQYEQGKIFHGDRHKREAELAAWENNRKAALSKKSGQVIEEILSAIGEQPRHVQPCYLFSEPSFQAIERAFAEGRFTLGVNRH